MIKEWTKLEQVKMMKAIEGLLELWRRAVIHAARFVMFETNAGVARQENDTTQQHPNTETENGT